MRGFWAHEGRWLAGSFAVGILAGVALVVLAELQRLATVPVPPPEKITNYLLGIAGCGIVVGSALYGASHWARPYAWLLRGLFKEIRDRKD